MKQRKPRPRKPKKTSGGHKRESFAWTIIDVLGDVLYYVLIRPVMWLIGKLASIGDNL